MLSSNQASFSEKKSDGSDWSDRSDWAVVDWHSRQFWLAGFSHRRTTKAEASSGSNLPILPNTPQVLFPGFSVTKKRECCKTQNFATLPYYIV